MRPTCLECAGKHLAQACILTKEYKTGYPSFRWFVIGHLAEAEEETVRDYPEFANEIREHRVAWAEDQDVVIPYEVLLGNVDVLLEELAREIREYRAPGTEDHDVVIPDEDSNSPEMKQAIDTAIERIESMDADEFKQALDEARAMDDPDETQKLDRTDRQVVREWNEAKPFEGLHAKGELPPGAKLVNDESDLTRLD